MIKNLDRFFFPFVTMHAFDGQTDRRTDGQTEFSSLDRVCTLHSIQRGKNRFFFSSFRLNRFEPFRDLYCCKIFFKNALSLVCRTVNTPFSDRTVLYTSNIFSQSQWGGRDYLPLPRLSFTSPLLHNSWIQPAVHWLHSVGASRFATSRSAPTLLFSVTPVHRSAPAYPIFGSIVEVATTDLYYFYLFTRYSLRFAS